MNKNIFIFFILILFSISLISAADLIPQGNVDLKGTYSIKNATNITFFNGTTLVNGSGFFGYLNFSWITNLPSYIRDYSNDITNNFTFVNNRVNTLNSSLISVNSSVNSINSTIQSSNSSWITTYNSTYAGYSSNVSRNYTKDTYDTYNQTWSQTYNETYDSKVTDNRSWNESRANTLYSPISAEGNASWNESLANSLYATKQWDYNQSSAIETLYGKWFYNMSTPFFTWLGTFAYNYNQTIATYNLYNTQWSDTHNTTYDSYSSNISRNWTANAKDYTDLINTTLTARINSLGNDNASWNESYARAFLGNNASWNQSYANELYIGSGNQTINGLINNASYLSTYNSTYNTWAYNMTTFFANWLATFNYNYNQTIATINLIQPNITSINTTANSLALTGNYTTGAITILNTTYGKFWYNSSSADQNYTDAQIIANLTPINSAITGNRSAIENNATINGLINNVSYLSTYNSTYASYATNVSLNYTSIVYTTYNTTWSATYNVTYESYSSNVSRNWTADGSTVYAPISWGYNMTTAVFTLYNTTWDNRGLIERLMNQVNNNITSINTTANIQNLTGNYTQGAINLLQPNISSINSSVNIQQLYNYTSATYNAYDTRWSNTSNVTYDGLINNASYLSTYNTTYASYATNVSINYTKVTYDTYNTTWGNTYNYTYDMYKDNVSRNWTANAETYTNSRTNMTFNQTLTDSLYSALAWGYNETIAVFNLYNTTWDNRYLTQTADQHTHSFDNLTGELKMDINSTITIGGIESPYFRTGEYENMLYMTEVFTNNTYWRVYNTTAYIENSSLDPIRSATAEYVVGANFTQTILDNNVTNFTFSVYLRNNASGTHANTIWLLLNSTDNVGTIVPFTIDSTWRRYEVTYDFKTLSTNKTVGIFSDGGSYHIWGVQLEHNFQARRYSGARTTSQIMLTSNVYTPSSINSNTLTSSGDVIAQGSDFYDDSGDGRFSGEDSSFWNIDYNSDDNENSTLNNSLGRFGVFGHNSQGGVNTQILGMWDERGRFGWGYTNLTFIPNYTFSVNGNVSLNNTLYVNNKTVQINGTNFTYNSIEIPRWLYNETTATFTLYNTTWDNRGTLALVLSQLITNITSVNRSDNIQQLYNGTAGMICNQSINQSVAMNSSYITTYNATYASYSSNVSRNWTANGVGIFAGIQWNYNMSSAMLGMLNAWTANQNMSRYNITSVDCITFKNGAEWCSA